MFKLIRQLFCKHSWICRKYYPLDKKGERLFEDNGLYSICEKCGKIDNMLPRIINDTKDKKDEIQKSN